MAGGLTRGLWQVDDLPRFGDVQQEVAALRLARRHAAVARSLRPDAAEVEALLQRVDLAERLWEVNREGERELLAGRLGENGGGALARFKDALALKPGQSRAEQGVAAVESAMIRRAEVAAERQEFIDAKRWLDHAAVLRPDSDTVPDARARIERERTARISRLRDQGVAVLGEYNGINNARKYLAELLRIARPGDLAAADLRERITLAVHYGLFGPGQVFTEAMKLGGRGPQMVVLPHGGFQMGSAAGDAGADQNDNPSTPSASIVAWRCRSTRSASANSGVSSRPPASRRVRSGAVIRWPMTSAAATSSAAAGSTGSPTIVARV